MVGGVFATPRGGLLVFHVRSGGRGPPPPAQRPTEGLTTFAL
jgi:hypothetical protein